MSDRFEMFGEDGKWLVKDNEQMPHLLDLYKCHIRMNMFVDKIADLEAKLDEFNSKIVEEMELSAERRQIIEDLTIENKQLEQQLTEKEKQIEKIMTGAYITANTLKKSFILRNQIIIEELEDVKNEFCKPHLNGNSQKTFSVNKLEKIVNSKIKRLNQQIKSLKGDK